jgi:serine protease Do
VTPDGAPTNQANRPAVIVPHNLGLSLSALTADLRAKYGLRMQQEGVVVDGVAAGTDAFERNLAPGDVILKMQDTNVDSAQAVQSAVDAARAESRRFILALVLPKQQQTHGPRWVALRV